MVLNSTAADPGQSGVEPVPGRPGGRPCGRVPGCGHGGSWIVTARGRDVTIHDDADGPGIVTGGRQDVAMSERVGEGACGRR